MSRRIFIVSLWLLACAAHFCAAFAGRPNVVLILADDMGYGDVGAYNDGSKIPTPHLDRLAAQGMRFTDAHSGGSTCVPSRYGLLTGRFAVRAALKWREQPVIEAGRMTIASLLRENGYRTAMVGKWHQGFKAPDGGSGEQFDYSKPLRGGPADRGFETYFGMHASLDIPPYFYIRDRAPVMRPTKQVAESTSVGGEEGWNKIQGAFWRGGPVSPDFEFEKVTPRFAEEAVKVIGDHGGREEEAPLFLYLALPSPHTPWLPAEAFRGKSGAGMYGDFVMQVDDVVGQVMAALEEAGMAEDTLIFFSSDNGPVWYDKDVRRFGHDAAGVLRGMKGDAWEGGHRVPFIARWPGKVEEGSENSSLISFVDLLATLGEIAGVEKLPPGAGEDSVSFYSALIEPGKDRKPRPPVVHNTQTIRHGKWKLITHLGSGGFSEPRRPKPEKGSPLTGQLYDLKKDPGETKNLFLENPEIVQRLQGELEASLGQ